MAELDNSASGIASGIASGSGTVSGIIGGTTDATKGKSLLVRLYMSELIYDFQNKAFLTGRSRRAAGKDAEFASNIQASSDDPDNNQAIRSIQNAYGELLVELGESLKEDSVSTSNNVLWTSKTKIEITLLLPSNYMISLHEALVSSIHDYLVNKALADWFLITNPEEAENYVALSAASMKNIHETFNRRTRPTRQNVGDEL